MSLQDTPPITMTQVQDEFLAPRGTPLSAFVRGGAWVPDISVNAGVPTTVPISILDMLGSSLTEPTELLVMGAETDPGSMGERTGYELVDPYGTMTPADYRGQAIQNFTMNVNNDLLRVVIDGTFLGQDFFDDVLIVGPNWNELVDSSTADYNPDVGIGFTRWDFTLIHAEFNPGSDYDLTFAFTP